MDLTHSPRTKARGAALVVKPAGEARWWRRARVDSRGELTLRSTKLRWWVFTLDLEGHANPLTRTTNMSFRRVAGVGGRAWLVAARPWCCGGERCRKTQPTHPPSATPLPPPSPPPPPLLVRRVATKWDISRGQWRNKRRVALGDGTEARVHWAVNYNLPEIEGCALLPLPCTRAFFSGTRRTIRAAPANPLPLPPHPCHARSFGAAANQRVSRQVRTDMGYAHLEVPRVELVTWPFGGRPSRPWLERDAADEEQQQASSVPPPPPQQQQQPAGDASGVAALASSSGGSSKPARGASGEELLSAYLPAYLHPPLPVGELAEVPPRSQQWQQQHSPHGGEGLARLRSHVRSLAEGWWQHSVG